MSIYTYIFTMALTTYLIPPNQSMQVCGILRVAKIRRMHYTNRNDLYGGIQ